MSLLDSVTKFLGHTTPTLNVCMMGPRGAGKTTILASIFSNAVEDFAPTKLYLRGRENTPSTVVLQNRKSELSSIFSRKGDIAGVSATNKDSVFQFEMGFKGDDKAVVNVDIKDFPGENLISKPDDVKKYIEESEIVLVAIDTAYLMSGNKELNEEMNKVELVTSFFENNPGTVANKLVLLVPLKCELYFHQDEIDDVTSKVIKTYSRLLNFFKSNNIACVVTPIQTLGDVEFDSFEENTRGVGVSQIATYRFSNENPKYRPMYCVQPLYYLLTYVADYNKWQQNQDSGSFVNNLKRKLIAMLMSNQKFDQEVRNLRKYMLTNTNGFEIVTVNSIWKS